MVRPLFPKRTDPPSRERHIHFIRESIKIARRALANGRHPFGCILVDEDGQILFTQGNIDTLNHAEATLCRTAWSNLSPSDLWKCTLYTNFEPCAMCAGSIYWANIGTVVYGCTEEKLLSLTGDDSENMTLNLSCRRLFESGQKDVRVFGPFQEIADEVPVFSVIGILIQLGHGGSYFFLEGKCQACGRSRSRATSSRKLSTEIIIRH